MHRSKTVGRTDNVQSRQASSRSVKPAHMPLQISVSSVEFPPDYPRHTTTAQARPHDMLCHAKPCCAMLCHATAGIIHPCGSTQQQQQQQQEQQSRARATRLAAGVSKKNQQSTHATSLNTCTLCACVQGCVCVSSRTIKSAAPWAQARQLRTSARLLAHSLASMLHTLARSLEYINHYTHTRTHVQVLNDLHVMEKGNFHANS